MIDEEYFLEQVNVRNEFRLVRIGPCKSNGMV